MAEARARWYIVHTYSGYEDKVKDNLEKAIANRHLEEQILEVRVPKEEVTEIRGSQKKTVQKKLYPGYVIINMFMNDETWYVVRNTRGVTGFVGPGSKPVPLRKSELKYLSSEERPRIVADLNVGDTVVVTGGAWKETTGVIRSVNQAKQVVTIEVELFGRATPVEISFSEVKKMA